MLHIKRCVVSCQWPEQWASTFWKQIITYQFLTSIPCLALSRGNADTLHHQMVTCMKCQLASFPINNALLRQKDIYWQQRAHAQWLHHNDRNSNYFHNSVKIRHHRNRINFIKDSTGNTFSSQTDIENCFKSHFQNLWTSSSSLSLSMILFPHYRMTCRLFLRRTKGFCLPLSLNERSTELSYPCLGARVLVLMVWT